MKRITKILEDEEAIIYLKARGVFEQYEKAKRLLLLGYPQLVDFKLREPKSNEIWYFRINRQYRAFGYFHGDEFTVSDIDDHQ